MNDLLALKYHYTRQERIYHKVKDNGSSEGGERGGLVSQFTLLAVVDVSLILMHL